VVVGGGSTIGGGPAEVVVVVVVATGGTDEVLVDVLGAATIVVGEVLTGEVDLALFVLARVVVVLGGGATVDVVVGAGGGGRRTVTGVVVVLTELGVLFVVVDNELVTCGVAANVPGVSRLRTIPMATPSATSTRTRAIISGLCPRSPGYFFDMWRRFSPDSRSRPRRPLGRHKLPRRSTLTPLAAVMP